MKNKRLFSLAAFLAVASAASLAAFTDAFAMNGSRSFPEPVAPIHHQETIGDLAYEFRLNSNQFSLNDEIEVYAQVTNKGDEPINYTSGSSSCPTHVGVDLVHQETNTRLAIKQDDRACTADLVTSTLAPGHTVHSTWTFIPERWQDSKLILGDIGDYDVLVSLHEASSPFAQLQQFAPSSATITLLPE
ncbi:hypothetical protein [Paenibacillus harenae]|uniref:Uncharacterized protein n=1 Tax=Paenibacillus harenae TaxID=306543 RepID=A0ABT9U1K9_PAEHA|nr:hypothetical protein [Paenibacillus harenae]MDQ0113433.1 hypothetical protein [Paenibacillus harenae]